jgi:hypothetical protein
MTPDIKLEQREVDPHTYSYKLLFEGRVHPDTTKDMWVVYRKGEYVGRIGAEHAGFGIASMHMWVHPSSKTPNVIRDIIWAVNHIIKPLMKARGFVCLTVTCPIDNQPMQKFFKKCGVSLQEIVIGTCPL